MQKIFAALFDFSFKKFVTPQLAGFTFVIAIVVAGVSALLMLRMPLGFIIAPVFFIASVVLARVCIEIALAVFQIARYSAEVARRGRPASTNDEAEEAQS